jgi:hypothetical protein
MKFWTKSLATLALCLFVMVGTASAGTKFGKDKAFYDPSLDKHHLGFSNGGGTCTNVYAWYLQPQTGRVALATTAGWPILGNEGKYMACSAQHWPSLEKAKAEALRRCNAMGKALHLIEACLIAGTK